MSSFLILSGVTIYFGWKVSVTRIFFKFYQRNNNWNDGRYTMGDYVKEYLKKIKIDLTILLFFGISVLFSYILSFLLGKNISTNFAKFFVEMIRSLP